MTQTSIPVRSATRQLPRLGSWELVECVHQGAWTEVHRARGINGSARDAYRIKVGRTELEHHPAAVGMFQREALASHQVNSPHLAALLAAELESSPRYLVFPWLEGTSIAGLLPRGALPAALALWYARQVAEGLHALHRAGWIHGDVSAANVIIGPDGHATLIDLGFAERIGPRAPGTPPATLGTLAYLAPEVVDSHDADPRSDMYSLGALLYQMLSGRPPFSGSSPVELVDAHRHQRPESLVDRLPRLPRDISEFTHQLLAKEPLRRPSSAAEVIDRLAALEMKHLPERLGAKGNGLRVDASHP